MEEHRGIKTHQAELAANDNVWRRMDDDDDDDDGGGGGAALTEARRLYSL